MKVTEICVLFHGKLRRRLRGSNEVLIFRTDKPVMGVRELLRDIGLEMSPVRVVIDGVESNPEIELKDGMTVEIYPPDTEEY